MMYVSNELRPMPHDKARDPCDVLPSLHTHDSGVISANIVLGRSCRQKLCEVALSDGVHECHHARLD